MLCTKVYSCMLKIFIKCTFLTKSSVKMPCLLVRKIAIVIPQYNNIVFKAFSKKPGKIKFDTWTRQTSRSKHVFSFCVCCLSWFLDQSTKILISCPREAKVIQKSLTKRQRNISLGLLYLVMEQGNQTFAEAHSNNTFGS